MKTAKRTMLRILCATTPVIGIVPNIKAFWKSGKPVPTSGIAKVADNGMRSATPVRRKITVIVRTVERYWEQRKVARITGTATDMGHTM